MKKIVFIVMITLIAVSAFADTRIFTVEYIQELIAEAKEKGDYMLLVNFVYSVHPQLTDYLGRYPHNRDMNIYAMTFMPLYMSVVMVDETNRREEMIEQYRQRANKRGE